MQDLFDQPAAPDRESRESNAPLAARMRPRSLDEYVGQQHILGPGKLLRRAIESDRLSSILLYGPAGVGKTSLAQIIATTTRSQFERMSAVESGVSDIRRVLAMAALRLKNQGAKTILFIDEIHRLGCYFGKYQDF
jgi:putative ATPase